MNNSELSRSIPVRYSNLKRMAQSPAHYLQSITREREDSRAMRIGRGVHAMVLGGAYDRFQGADRRAKGYAEFERNAKSDTVLTDPEYYECKRIADAVLHDNVAALELSGVCENKIETVLGTRAIRGTPDAYDLHHAILSDLKTTQCSNPEQFSRQAVNMNYVGQLAWYRMLIRMVRNVDIRTFRLVAVETSAPYCVSVINVPLDLIDEADKVNRTWFERLIECESSGNFPGYTGGKVVEFVKSKRNITASDIFDNTDESEAA